MSVDIRTTQFLAAAVIIAALASTSLWAEEMSMTLRLTPSAFADGSPIPSKYTCEGQDISPPLAWTGVPDKTKSLVLIVDDPNAPDPKAPRMTCVHWVLYDLPPSASKLPEAAGGLPPGTKVVLESGGLAQMMSRMPMRRPGFPDDLAKAVLFLASDLASYVSGTSLIVDGAQTLA